jgi:hypothetical protein
VVIAIVYRLIWMLSLGVVPPVRAREYSRPSVR